MNQVMSSKMSTLISNIILSTSILLKMIEVIKIDSKLNYVLKKVISLESFKLRYATMQDNMGIVC